MAETKSSLLDYVKREREIFTRYNRAHPHFKRNIFIDAVISSALVLVGFAAFNHLSEGARIYTLMRSGGVAMTSDELIKYVRNGNIEAYWFGPKPGYKYTIISEDQREIVVTYLPLGSSPNHPDRFNLTVETYSKTLGSESPAMSNISSDRDDFVTSSGVAATIYPNRPRNVKFAIPHSDKYVEVQYPSARRIHSVYKDGGRLSLISEF